METARDKTLYKFLLAVIFITLVIPKAGDKVAGVPLTLASLLFGLLLLFSVPILFKTRIPLTDKCYLIYVSVVLVVPWLFFAGDIGAFARTVLPLVVSLIVFYWVNPITQSIINNKDRLYRLVKLVAIANIIIVLYGLAQKIFGHYQTIIPGITMAYSDAKIPDIFYYKANIVGSWIKVTSTYQNGNLFGTNLVITMFPVVAAFLYSREKADKILFGISSALSYIIIPFTLSRSVLFGALIGSGVLFLVQRGKRNRVLITLLVLLIFVVTLASPFLTERMIGQFFDPTMHGRTEVMKNVVTKAQPTLKSGAFGLGFSANRPQIDTIFHYSSENMYLTIFIWTGFIGVALFVMVVGSLLIKMFKYIRANPPDSIIPGLVTGTFAGLAGYLIQGFVDGAFHLLPIGFTFWLLIGLGNVLTGQKLNYNLSKEW